MIKVAVCDDDLSQIKIIEEYLKMLANTYTVNIKIDCYSSADTLISHYTRTTMDGYYDIVYMDIEVGNCNGVLAAKKIRDIDRKALIIYITNFRKYVFDASDTGMFRFLLKPVLQDKFNEVFEDAYKTINAKGKTYTFFQNKMLTRVFTEEIIYIEIDSRKLLMHTSEKDYRFYGKMKTVAKELAPAGFCLVHASYLINMACIREFGPNKVILQTGAAIPVSEAHRADLEIAFTSFERDRCNL